MELLNQWRIQGSVIRCDRTERAAKGDKAAATYVNIEVETVGGSYRLDGVSVEDMPKYPIGAEIQIIGRPVLQFGELRVKVMRSEVLKAQPSGSGSAVDSKLGQKVS